MLDFDLEYAIRMIQENQVGLKLNRSHQLLVYADAINLLGCKVGTIKKSTQGLIDACKKIVLQVKGYRSRYSDWLQAGRPKGRSSSPGGYEISFIHVAQTGSGAPQPSYLMGIGGSSPRAKRSGCEADHSPLNSAEVKKTWFCTFTSPYVFMA
jgi:hypothetical protein